jgi:hypothetical protein
MQTNRKRKQPQPQPQPQTQTQTTTKPQKSDQEKASCVKTFFEKKYAMYVLGPFLTRADLLSLHQCCHITQTCTAPIVVPMVLYQHDSLRMGSCILPYVRVVTEAIYGVTPKRVGKPPLVPLGLLPNLRKVTCSDYQHVVLAKDMIPDWVTDLTFGSDFDEKLIQNVLPKHSHRLQFGHNFNQPISQGVLPETLVYLSFGPCYNMPLCPGAFPDTLKGILFGHNFNQPIPLETLPRTLKSLAFGDSFNHPFEQGVLQESLQSLRLGKFYEYNLTPFELPIFSKPMYLVCPIWCARPQICEERNIKIYLS